MATIRVIHRNIARGTIRGEWVTPFGANDTGQVYQAPQYVTKTVAVSGTFGTATMTLQGSNDGVNFFTLHDPQGNALTFTTATARMEKIAENPRDIQPVSSGGDGTTAITVTIDGDSRIIG